MRSVRYVPLLFFLPLFAGPVLGQEVVVVGRVIDDVTETPLDQVDVFLRRPNGSLFGRVQTDSVGTFEMTIRGRPSVQLHVARVGYEATTTPDLHFEGRSFFQIEVRLDPEAILLAPLEILARSAVDRSPLLDGFRRRIDTGQGIYILRSDVERRAPVFVTDLLREVPGLRVTSSGAGIRPVVQTTRSAGRLCSTQIFLDGFLMNRRVAGRGQADFRIDDVVSPVSIEGIEVYRGGSTTPAEFLTPDAACGVIAIWTRRGGR